MNPINNNGPNLIVVAQNLMNSPVNEVGGINKVELITLCFGLAKIDNINDQCIQHLRPNETGLSRPIEISGSDIYVINKDWKLGTGAVKEVCGGIHLNTLKPIAHATIDEANLPETEIKINELLHGCEEFVQMHNLSFYQSKKDPEKYKFGITMELCNQGDLKEVYDAGKIDFNNKKTILSIVDNMIKILETLEQKKVLHRDIKAENFFINDDGNVQLKIGDFGLSGIIEEDKDRLTADKNRVGYSLDTVPPEIAQKSDVEQMCSPKIDVWSMGVVLYEFLVGELPEFMKESKIAHSDQGEVDEVLQDLVDNGTLFDCINKDMATRSRLEEIVCGMLQINPNDRATAADLREIFQTIPIPTEEVVD